MHKLIFKKMYVSLKKLNMETIITLISVEYNNNFYLQNIGK